MSARDKQNELKESIIDVLFLLFGVALVVGLYTYFTYHDKAIQWFEKSYPTYSINVFIYAESLLIPVVFAFTFFFFWIGVKRFYRISVDLALQSKKETT